MDMVIARTVFLLSYYTSETISTCTCWQLEEGSNALMNVQFVYHMVECFIRKITISIIIECAFLSLVSKVSLTFVGSYWQLKEHIST